MSEDDEAIGSLRKLARAHIGRTIIDDEWIGTVCEEAMHEIDRLRGYLDTLRGMAGGLADHGAMQAVAEEALASAKQD